MKIGAAILAGGRARRLGGVDKALVDVGGVAILDRQLAALARVAGEILLVGARGIDRPGIRAVADARPDLGPLGGIAAAFGASDADALLVVGCDLPFLDDKLLALVRDSEPRAQAVVPRVGGRPQALHARYARSIVPAVESRLARGERRLLDLVGELEVSWLDEPALRAIDPELRGLTNVNTPEELAAARARASRLRLRPLEPGDVERLVGWLAQPVLLERYGGRDQKFDAARVRAEFFCDDEVSRRIVEWEGHSIGFVQFYPVLDEELSEYGYPPSERVWGMDQFLGEPSLWDRGIGSELVRSVAASLVEEGASRVVLDPQVSNARALRCYEKAGFRRVKRLPLRERHEGALRDCWLMEFP